MALTVGELVAEIKVDAGQTPQQLAAVESQMGKVAATAAKADQATGSLERSEQKLTTSLREQSREWQTVGGVVTAAGAATTALTVGVLKTGTAYNSLQQTSRAALTTMLGASKAVAAQMGKLDEFARTSPFSKSTFITAQQQMLAFGVETEKVIPYLSAINDATAAAGGNSQTLGELAFVMAQISAAGKITGQDLIQFGQRGVNAAELIGSQMGKTGAQIRQDITDGALSADVALDALAAGMSEKFEGASANVKNTFGGAVDRIKAAWRDLAAEMAEPLVSAEGGGLLVDAANGLADVLRWVQALPDPLKYTVGGLTALTGAAGTVTGATLLMLPRLIETKKALDAITLSSPGAAKALGLVGKSAGVAGVALATYFTAEAVRTWENNAGTVSAGAEEMAEAFALLVEKGDTSKIDALLSGGGSWSDFSKKSKDQANAIDGLADAIGRYKAANDEANSGGSSWFGNESGKDILGGTAAWNQAVKSMEAFDAAIAAIVESGDPEALAAAQKYLADAAGESGLTIDQVAGAMPKYSAALKAAGAETAEAGVDVLQAAKDAEAAQKALVASYDAFVELYGGAAAAFIDLGGAYDGVIEKNTALAQSTADATKDSKDSWETYYNGVDVSMKDYLKGLEAQVEAQQAWKDNLTTLAGKVSEETLASLAALGPEGAALVADLVDASDKQLAKLDMATAAKTETDAFIAEILAAQGRIPELEVHAGVTGYENVYSKLQAIQAQIRAINGSKVRVAMGPGGQGGTTFATGGAVRGPGSGTSDDVPAWLSNGEHVLTEREVQALGGHDAVERWRAAALAGALPAFASGGRVDAAQSKVKSARRDVTDAQKTYDAIDGKKANAAAKKAAKADLDRQKKQLKRAEDDLKEARDALKEERARAARLGEARDDLRTDVRRGDIVDQVTSGLSGGYSVVDRLYEQSRNKDLSKKQRHDLASTARVAEAALSGLYAQAEGIETRLSLAKDHTEALASIKADVASVLGSGVLGDSLGQKTQWGHDKPVTAAGLLASAQKKVGALKTFAGKLDKLAALGVAGVILREIAKEGLEDGTVLADALLGDTSTINSLNGAYAEIDRWSQAAGTSATKNTTIDGVFYAEGLAQAEQAVAGMQATLDGVTSSISAWASTLENALLSSLDKSGLPSVSSVVLSKGTVKKATKKASGGPITGGVPGVDSVPVLAMPDEHMWTVDEVRAAGGHGVMYAMRAAARSGRLPLAMAGGGAVPGTAGARMASSVASAAVGSVSASGPAFDAQEMYATVYGAVRDGLAQTPIYPQLRIGGREAADVHRLGSRERSRNERVAMQQEIGVGR